MSTKPKPVRANNSHDRTLDKYIKDEVQAQKRGAAFTKQMQRVVDKCADDLAVIIAHERATRRPDKDPGIWAVVGKVSDLSLAYTMVVAGLHAGLRSFKPARKFKYKPTAQKWYHYVGLELGFEKDEPALVAGMWASKLLTQLPPFILTDEGMMEVRLDLPEVQELVRGAINYLVTRKPQLLPWKDLPTWSPAGAADVITDAKPSVCIVQIGAPDLVTHHPSVAEQFNADIAWGRGRNVIDALDHLQQTPYTINRPILELLKLNPHNIPPKKPNKPETWDKRNKSEDHYRAKLRLWMKDYAKWLNWHWMVQEAELLCDASEYPGDEFGNNLKLDFRGRLVVLQSFAYQGDDATRSLFLFKNGEPIGEEGLRWLKAHVAARASGCPWSDVAKPDKLSLKGRIAWTERWHDRLVAIGKRILDGTPLDTNDLPEKDERYQFAAACAEYAQAHDNPKFVTRLPLVFDASCSGLQHIAMMLRSEDGRLANFYPGEEPSDLYEIVAKHVRENTDLLKGIPEGHHRKIVKRPTMTTFYGVTDHGMAEQIYEELIDLMPREMRTNEACVAAGEKARALAKAVATAIAETVKSVTVYRSWIEELCLEYVKANKSMRWPAPWLTVINPYYKMLFVDAVHGRGENRTQVRKWCKGNTDDVHR